MIGYALASARTRCGALYPSLGPPPSDPSPDAGPGQTEASLCLTAAPVRDANSSTLPTSGRSARGGASLQRTYLPRRPMKSPRNGNAVHRTPAMILSVVAVFGALAACGSRHDAPNDSAAARAGGTASA